MTNRREQVVAGIGALLLVIGTVGTAGAILFGGPFIGPWALPASVAFVIVGVIGVIVVGGRHR